MFLIKKQKHLEQLKVFKNYVKNNTNYPNEEITALCEDYNISITHPTPDSRNNNGRYHDFSNDIIIRAENNQLSTIQLGYDIFDLVDNIEIVREIILFLIQSPLNRSIEFSIQNNVFSFSVPDFNKYINDLDLDCDKKISLKKMIAKLYMIGVNDSGKYYSSSNQDVGLNNHLYTSLAASHLKYNNSDDPVLCNLIQKGISNKDEFECFLSKGNIIKVNDVIL